MQIYWEVRGPHIPFLKNPRGFIEENEAVRLELPDGNLVRVDIVDNFTGRISVATVNGDKTREMKLEPGTSITLEPRATSDMELLIAGDFTQPPKIYDVQGPFEAGQKVVFLATMVKNID